MGQNRIQYRVDGTAALKVELQPRESGTPIIDFESLRPVAPDVVDRYGHRASIHENTSRVFETIAFGVSYKNAKSLSRVEKAYARRAAVLSFLCALLLVIIGS